MEDKADRGGFFFRVGQDDAQMQMILSEFRNQGWGKLSRACHNGLRLIWDLSHQRTDVLMELFPFVKDAICHPNSSLDPDQIDRRLANIEAKLDKRSTEGYVPAMENNFPLMQPGPKMLAGANIVLPPPDDDDDIEVNKANVEINVSSMMSTVMDMMQ